MGNEVLIERIQDAKDRFGVITSSALHSQLNDLTAADWRELANVYSKSSASPGGFYITDDSHGKVIIHNDIGEAKIHADSALKATVHDAVGTVLGAAGFEGLSAATAGLMVPMEFWSGATLASAAAGAGMLLVGSTAVIGSVSAAIVAVDGVRNVIDKSQARDDVQANAVLTWQSK